MINLKELMEQFSQLNITEFNYKDKDVELKLKKELAAAPILHAATALASASQAAPLVPTPTVPVSAPAPIIEDPKIHIVKSPLVGTFYRSPAPGQKEFIQVGQKISKGDVLCIVEAMKVMNSIESDASGEIVEILQEAGSTVEFGTALVKIRTA